METYEAASYITSFGFASTLLTNSFLIYLTIFHIKNICATYKWMIVTFAFIGILFSLLEVIVHPCVHNFNGAFMFFSLNLYLPKWLMSLGVACYGGFYSSLLAFVTMQFIFRCWTLLGSKLVRTFRGWKLLFWILFVVFPCSFFAVFIPFSIAPDDYTDGYMQEETLQVYELGIHEVPRFIMIAYDNDGVRWKNVSFVAATSVILSSDLWVIVYCALTMRKEMKTRLKAMSKKNQRLETQFFKALLAQSAFPTFLLALPAGPVMLLPFFYLEVSLQSGFLFSLFSLYPPMDSIAMMVIITEYQARVKKILRDLRNLCGTQGSQENEQSEPGISASKSNSRPNSSKRAVPNETATF